jgi:hypothetical protein
LDRCDYIRDGYSRTFLSEAAEREQQSLSQFTCPGQPLKPAIDILGRLRGSQPQANDGHDPQVIKYLINDLVLPPRKTPIACKLIVEFMRACIGSGDTFLRSSFWSGDLRCFGMIALMSVIASAVNWSTETTLLFRKCVL